MTSILSFVSNIQLSQHFSHKYGINLYTLLYTISHDISVKSHLPVHLSIPQSETDSQFVWANGGAAGIGRTIPVRSIWASSTFRRIAVSSTRYLEEPAELPKQNGRSS